MTSTWFASAPAGVLGSGSADARPYACVTVRPALLPPVAVEGARVPFADMGRRRGAEVLAGFEGALQATGLPIAQQHDPISKNDGTTPLGIPPRGRSTS